MLSKVGHKEVKKLITCPFTKTEAGETLDLPGQPALNRNPTPTPPASPYAWRMKIPAEAGILHKINAAITYSRLATTIGRAGLTAVFGMVTGVSLHVSSPRCE